MKLSQYALTHNSDTTLHPNQDEKGKDVHQTVIIRNMLNIYDSSDC